MANMAWDDPHGNLSYDERRRLEREAEIYVEAQRKMLREEAKKQREIDERHREEERQRRDDERRWSESLASRNMRSGAETKASKERRLKSEKCQALVQYVDKFKRVNTVRSSAIGSTKYLIARYGKHAYRIMLDTVIQALNITEQEAADYLTENYSEALWKTGITCGNPI